MIVAKITPQAKKLIKTAAATNLNFIFIFFITSV